MTAERGWAGRFTKSRSDRDRILSRIDRGDACWLWTGCTDAAGYGRTWFREGNRAAYAHRAAYELLVGPIPPGLTIDHLCRNRACCNPEHLEVVTRAENIRRGEGASVQNARKTHCLRGHPFNAENTYIHTNGGRRCRICQRERVRS